MDFRTPELDALANEVIPTEYFELSSDDARDKFFADTRMLDGKQLVHNRYRTNPRSMVDHMLDNLTLTGSEELLDLGCGNGFVLEYIRPYMAQGRIVGLDIASGVLEAARQRLMGVATECAWVEGSADNLAQFATDSFDRVMANYMMHYVPNIDRCFSETRRVLRPGGKFMLTTDRPDSMVEMYNVHFSCMAEMGAPERLFKASPKSRISLTNGQAQLAPHFDHIELKTWQDQLRFTHPDPFLHFYAAHNYCCAASQPGELSEEFFGELRERARAKVVSIIESDGHFAITKFTGSFICS